MGKKKNYQIKKDSGKLPLVSVIITTKNEEKNIGNCLESIRRQTYPQNKIEIIVVDNNSTDRTKDIARQYTKKVYNKGPERSAQRNYGMIEKAKGEYVMYLDTDMILSSTVIERAINLLTNSKINELEDKIANHKSQITNKLQISSPKFQKGFKRELVALYIPEVVLGNSFWSQVRRFERSFYDGTVIDCVRIIRKDTFEKVGGFDLSMTGPEDWDLDKKIRQVGEVGVLGEYDFEEINTELINLLTNSKINELRNESQALNSKGSGFVDELVSLTRAAVIFHNEVGFNLRKYLAKKHYYAQSFVTYIQKWGRDDPDIRKQFGFWYRYFGVFLENGKWRRLLRHPLLALGMYFLRGLVGATYVVDKIKRGR